MRIYSDIYASPVELEEVPASELPYWPIVAPDWRFGVGFAGRGEVRPGLHDTARFQSDYIPKPALHLIRQRS